MSAEPAGMTMTREEYLALEKQSADKHEYVRGRVYPRHRSPFWHAAMAGARRRHVRLVTRLGGLLDAQLIGGPCEVYTNDMRLRVEAADADYYPDLFIHCGGKASANPLELRDARVVIEVLSPGTEGYDLTDKFEAYRLLPGLEAYIVIATRRIAATIYSRTPDQQWLVQPIGAEDVLDIPGIGFRTPLSGLYAGISFEPEEEA